MPDQRRDNHLIRTNEIIIQLHRYIGIPMSVIVVVWFASGIVMMYTRGMPALGVEQSLALKSAVPIAEIDVTPAEALRRNNLRFAHQELTIDALLLRPAYRFGGGITVFADNGELFTGADEDSGREIVATAFRIPLARVQFAGELAEPDQWTITERRHLPVLKYVLDDELSTEAYVSVTTGEIILVTDRTSRFLAWIGAIPHWIYFTTLRTNQPAWYRTVVVLSTTGCLIVIMGLILTFTQFRKSTPFSLQESIRYRGLMRWHYLTGAVFGLLALTWLFSGLLSMDPFEWNSQRGLDIDEVALNSGPPIAESLPPEMLTSLPGGRMLKRLELINVLGELRIIAHHSGDEGKRVTDPENPGAFPGPDDTANYVSRLEAITGTEISDAELLREYDSYYYDRDHRRPLPVLRISFDDPGRTTAYLDPATGRIAGLTHRLARLDRWLFNGLHSLDFGFWYDKRPLWDIAVIALSLGGLATSGIGMWLGFRRMRRWLARRHAST